MILCRILASRVWNNRLNSLWYSKSRLTSIRDVWFPQWRSPGYSSTCSFRRENCFFFQSFVHMEQKEQNRETARRRQFADSWTHFRLSTGQNRISGNIYRQWQHTFVTTPGSADIYIYIYFFISEYFRQTLIVLWLNDTHSSDSRHVPTVKGLTLNVCHVSVSVHFYMCLCVVHVFLVPCVCVCVCARKGMHMVRVRVSVCVCVHCSKLMMFFLFFFHMTTGSEKVILWDTVCLFIHCILH